MFALTLSRVIISFEIHGTNAHLLGCSKAKYKIVTHALQGLSLMEWMWRLDGYN
jgi:hypothetical protein